MAKQIWKSETSKPECPASQAQEKVDNWLECMLQNLYISAPLASP
jgi:hypothetical protein